MLVVDHCGHLPAQSKVHGQVRTEAPIVLGVQAKNGLAQSRLSYGAEVLPGEPERVVGKKSSQSTEIEDPAGIGVPETVELHALDLASKFERVGSMRPKGVVISLEGVPAIVNVGISIHTARKLVNNAADNHVSGGLPGYGEERLVVSQGVDGTLARIVQLMETAKSRASGIHQRGAKSMGLLQAHDLAMGIRADPHVIEAIGRAVRSKVVQVGDGQDIVLRKLVVGSDGKKVFGDLPLSAEGISCGITGWVVWVRDGRNGPEGQVALGRGVYHDLRLLACRAKGA